MSCSIYLTLAAGGSALQAQSLYKYRDANGAWVYTDRQPPADVKSETVSVNLEARAPRITVEQRIDGAQLTLSAINDCACEVEYALRIDSPGNLSLVTAGKAAAGAASGTYE
ncbi:MAG TPA: DUF4124 domain-containing protein, partial [Steroidobacteraceae bacterium]